MSKRIFTLVMSCENYEVSGYNLDLDLLTISCQSSVSYPKRSGLDGKSNHLRPMYHIGVRVYMLKTWMDERYTHMQWVFTHFCTIRLNITCSVMVFYDTMVTFLITLLMDTFTSIIILTYSQFIQVSNFWNKFGIFYILT